MTIQQISKQLSSPDGVMWRHRQLGIVEINQPNLTMEGRRRAAAYELAQRHGLGKQETRKRYTQKRTKLPNNEDFPWLAAFGIAALVIVFALFAL